MAITISFRTNSSGKKSAHPNVIPHDAYHQFEDENRGDDPPTEARLNVILQEREARGIKLIERLQSARKRKDKPEEAHVEIKIQKNVEGIRRARQLLQDIRAQGSHSQGSHSQGSHYPNSHSQGSHYPGSHSQGYHSPDSHPQGSHPPQQEANTAVRRVPSAYPDPPHLGNSRITAEERSVHFGDPMDAERGYRTQGEQHRYGQATQTYPVYEHLERTVDNQPDGAHFQGLVDVEREYRTHNVPTDARHHTDIHEQKLTRHLYIEPNDAESPDQMHGLAQQCCKCSAVRTKTKPILRCHQCSHLMCEGCTSRTGKWLLKVEVDEQGKIWSVV